MSVLLEKGEGVSLEKDSSGKPLTQVTICLGWKAKKRLGGPKYDLDASAFVLDADDTVLGEPWFAFYGMKKIRGQLITPDGAVLHHGDDLVGGDGNKDDEQITVKFDLLSDDAVRIVVPVTIFKAEERRQNFGQVSKAFIRVVDQSGEELYRYELAEDFSSETGVIFAELIRGDDGWHFNAIGEAFEGGLAALCSEFGVTVRQQGS